MQYLCELIDKWNKEQREMEETLLIREVSKFLRRNITLEEDGPHIGFLINNQSENIEYIVSYKLQPVYRLKKRFVFESEWYKTTDRPAYTTTEFTIEQLYNHHENYTRETR